MWGDLSMKKLPLSTKVYASPATKGSFRENLGGKWRRVFRSAPTGADAAVSHLRLAGSELVGCYWRVRCPSPVLLKHVSGVVLHHPSAKE
jgi:hypothetical protein